MSNENKEIAVLGGGCFWCTEAVFMRVNGIIEVIPGYCGGESDSPTYEAVSSGKTNFAESIKITFDNKQISFEQILEVFFATHNPTTLNKQGADEGTQYRSVIFYTDEVQKQIAENLIEHKNQSNEFSTPIVTTLEKFKNFYTAEEYHQRYYDNNPNNPYCSIVISPKLKKLFEKFPNLIKS